VAALEHVDRSREQAVSKTGNQIVFVKGNRRIGLADWVPPPVDLQDILRVEIAAESEHILKCECIGTIGVI
jgi:hypothetical protein